MTKLSVTDNPPVIAAEVDVDAVTEVHVNCGPELRDLSALAPLTKTRELLLNMQDGPIPDFSPLKDWLALESLDVYAFWGDIFAKPEPPPSLDQLVSLPVFKNLKKLSISSYISQQGLNLEPLALLPQLEQVNLNYSAHYGHSEPLDLSPLAQLPRLTKLSLVVPNNSSLAPLKDCQSLELLSIPYHCDLELEPISEIFSLKSMSLQSSCKNLNFLKGLENLQSLQMLDGCTDLEDITGLSHCPQLETLTLSIVAVKDLSSLRSLTQLTSLHLRNGRYETESVALDIAPLASLQALKDLGLVGVSGLQLGSLKSLAHLEKIYLGACHASDFEALMNCPELKSVVLRNTNAPSKELRKKWRELRPGLEIHSSTVDYWGN